MFIPFHIKTKIIDVVTLKHTQPSHTFCVYFRKTSNGIKLCNEDLKNCITTKELYNNYCDTIPVNYITILLLSKT